MYASNKAFQALYLNGAISLELVPQGTLAERLRAHAAGLPAFFTPTGANTAVEHGLIPIRYNPGGMSEGVAIPGLRKEAREFAGRRYVLEHALAGDVAFVRAWKVDEAGNCVFRWVGHAQGMRLNASRSEWFAIDMRVRISARSWLRMPS